MKNRTSYLRNQITGSRGLLLWLAFVSLSLSVSCVEEDPTADNGENATQTPPDDDPPTGEDPATGQATPLGDVTDRVAKLGNPLSERYRDGTQRVYARNVWDMHSYHGKIYFGGGNSSNYSPATNAGPADLWAFDPTSRKFTREYTVDEEQIHLIREFDDELYLPGHDSRESWDAGNFYRLESGVWKKHRTIPNGIHVYDIYKFGKKLYAGIGPRDVETSGVQVSSDNGQTWSNAYDTGGSTLRIYSLVPLNGALFANYSWIYCPEEDGDFSIYSPIEEYPSFMGGIKLDGPSRVERAVVFNGQTIYILGYTYNDHQYIPAALMRARGFRDMSALPLPEDALVRDIRIEGEWLLVLASVKVGREEYKNFVFATRDADADPVEWTPLFHFTAPAFARSFEYLDGNFYFGLGCDAGELTDTTWLSPATGDILSVEYEGLE